MLRKLLVVFAVLLMSLDGTPVYAYIDPNTGGFFFQTVAPFVYGLLGVIVIFWKRITGFIKGIFSRTKASKHSTDN